MSDHTTIRRGRPHRPLRTLGAVGALVAVVAGVPALLVVCARAGLDAAHPLPGIGSAADISEYFRRGLSTSEVTSITLRSLLLVGWVLWAAMVSSVAGAIVEAHRGRRASIPQFRPFAGLGRWIAVRAGRRGHRRAVAAGVWAGRRRRADAAQQRR